jgi:hypothetical protein
MDLILANNANSAVELTTLGFTVPANDVYDITLRPRTQVGNDAELLGLVANGVLQLIDNPDANATTYYSASDAQQLITLGVSTTALGMGAIKSIDLGTGPSLYSLNPSNGKYLSIGFGKLDFTSANTSHKTWLQVSSSFAGAQVGYIGALPVTMVLVTAFSDSSAEKSLSMYIDDVEYANVIVFANTYVAGSNISSVPLSIDLGYLQKCRFRVVSDTTGSLGAVYLTSYFSITGGE